MPRAYYSPQLHGWVISYGETTWAASTLIEAWEGLNRRLRGQAMIGSD